MVVMKKHSNVYLIISSILSLLLTPLNAIFICFAFLEGGDSIYTLIITAPIFVTGIIFLVLNIREISQRTKKKKSISNVSNINEPNTQADYNLDIPVETSIFDDEISSNYSQSTNSFYGESGMLEAAIRVVVIYQQASHVFLQRKLRIGYTQATHLLSQLEQRGIIGPIKRDKTHDVLMTKEHLSSRKDNQTKANDSYAAEPTISEKTKEAIDRGEFYNDSLLRSAIRFIVDESVVTVAILQNKFHLNSLQAQQLMQDLEYLKIVSLPDKDNKQYPLILCSQITDLFDILGHTIVKEEYKDRYKSIEYSSSNNMSGYEFEEYCCNLLRGNGFSNIIQTKKSNDYGIDITAEKDGISFAIQCKYYSSPVGNKAIQEAYTGAQLYNCDIAVVMTNSTFTPQAINTAKQTKVKLWDEKKLNEMASKINS